MRLLIDACLPYWLADAIRPVAALDGIKVDHIPALYGDGVADVDWIRAASEDGGALFVTADRHMRTRPREVQALIGSVCIGIVLRPQWQECEPHELVANLLRRWPHILACLKMPRPALVEFTWAHESRAPRPWRGWR